jgi:serine/threonine protein kinase
MPSRAERARRAAAAAARPAVSARPAPRRARPHATKRPCAWQEYGPEADLWSVGMLTYQLLTGGFPFWDNVQNLTLQQARALC